MKTLHMAKVVQAGYSEDRNSHLFDELDQRTIANITNALDPSCRHRNASTVFSLLSASLESPVYAMLKGMKPWMAFFTIFSRFLETNGWKYSVDMEAYRVAGEMRKKVVSLETIEEQIEVLESLSNDRIIEFLKRIDRWKAYTKEFVRWYLNADLEKIRSNPYAFPTRHPSVIEDRDEILCERMLAYLEKGDAVACVGAPHVLGISEKLTAQGFQVHKYEPR